MSEPARLVLRTAAPDQTQALAAELAALCVPGDVLLLAGDLGSGKTTFVQGFGAGLGVTERITSPTFTLVRQYPVVGVPNMSGRYGTDPVQVDREGNGEGTADGHSRVRSLLHADVWRLDNLHEIVDLGLGELVEDGAVALVEWGDAAEPLLGSDALGVQLAAGVDADSDGGPDPDRAKLETGGDGADDDRRRITLRPSGPRWTARWDAVVGRLDRWKVAA